MARCTHEGICNCDVQPGHGITVTGRGQPNNPFIIAADGQALVSNGLAWDPNTKRFSAKLGSGGGLTFDAAGGLILSEKGGEGGIMPGASVTEMLKRAANQNVVGGWQGAGYMIKPQGTRGTYTYGVQRGVDMMHVPVRFLTDGTPVVTPSEELTTQNGAGISDYPDRRTLVAEQTVHRWRLIAQKPGTVANLIPDEDVPPDPPEGDPFKGWFGYLEPNEAGLSSLADVFDLVGRSSVLVLDLRFPPIDYSEGGVPSWHQYAPSDTQITQFLDRTRVLIQRYGLQQSVIVTTGTPTIPAGTTTRETSIDVLAEFVNAAIPAGPMFPTASDAGRYQPGPNWPNGWLLAFFHHSIPPETVKTYTDAGIHSFYYPISRQHQHADLVQPSGAAGVLSPDPEYYAGQFSDHPTMGSYAYRMRRDRFWFSTTMPGMLPPTENLDTVHPAYRGYMPRKPPTGSYLQFGQHCFRPAPTGQPSGTYSVLHGWISPLADPSNYALYVVMDVGRPDPGGGPVVDPVADPVSCTLAFALPEDRPFTSLTEMAGHAGYLLSYHTEGADNHGKRVQLWGWDPDETDPAKNPVELMHWAPDWTGSKAGFRIRVNKNRIEVQAVSADDPSQVVGEPWDSATAPAPAPKVGTLYRGGYVFTGRTAADPNHVVQAQFKQLWTEFRNGG